MKKLCWLFLMALASVHAAKITIDNEELECKKIEEEKSAFICQKDNQDIFIAEGGYGFSAYLKNKKGHLVIKSVSKVIDENQILFEVPSYPGLGGMYGGFNTNLNTNGTLADRRMYASVISNSLLEFKNPLARELISDAQNFLERTSSLGKIKFETKSGDFSCEANETRNLTEEEKRNEETYRTKIKCEMYSCKDSNGREALAYFSSEVGALNQPNLLILNPKGEEELIFKDLKVKVLDGEWKGEKLYEFMMPTGFGLGGGIGGYGFPSSGGLGSTSATADPNLINRDTINEEDFIPSKIKNNYALFNHLTNPHAAALNNFLGNLCVGNDIKNLLKKRDELSSDLSNVLLKESLSQLVSILDGQLIGSLIPTENVHKYGCYFNGMYITPKALSQLEYIKKLNTKADESKLLTEKEVQDLFNKAKNMKDIPFDYKIDGCYARAHVMARRFEAMGIPTEKVWIKGDLSVPGTDIRWNFHVAPVVNVKNPKTGKVMKYVIDPSLTSKAVPVDDWVSAMKSNVRGPVVKTSFPIPLNVATMDRTAVALSSSDPYFPNGDNKTPETEIMRMAEQIMKDYSQELSKVK